MSEDVFYGNVKVKIINILGMYRNNSKYFEFLFRRFEEWEHMYNVEFRYFFLENNSIDDTRQNLLDFVKHRKHSKVLLYNMKKDYENIDDGRNFDRINTLARLRNKLLNCITPLPEDEWCLFVDSNLYFKQDIIREVFSQNITDTDAVGMMCVYTQQLLLPEYHLKNATEPVLMNHFYDTYSMLDTQNRSFYPLCAFEKCAICTKYQTTALERIPKDLAVVEVNSCFGGFVFIKSEILNNERIRWDTILYDSVADKSLCEHFLFCDRLRNVSGKKIVMLQNIDTLYRTI